MPTSAHRILLVRLSSMGDVILTTPLVRALRARHPEAKITYLTRPAFVPLLADHPAGVEVLTFDPAKESLGSLATRLRALQFTHLLDLHGVTRTRLLRLLVPGQLARVQQAAGGEMDAGAHQAGRLPRLSARGRAVLRGSAGPGRAPGWAARRGGHRDRGGNDRGRAWLAEHGLGGRPMAALAPGAAHFTKRWPTARMGHAVPAAGRARASTWRY